MKLQRVVKGEDKHKSLKEKVQDLLQMRILKKKKQTIPEKSEPEGSPI